MTGGVLWLLGALAVATVLGLVLRARAGTVRTTDASAADPLTPADLGGHGLGTTATLVQMSAQTCTTCRATARVLGELASRRPGVVHVELDVAEHPALTRRLDVLRTPTVVVLDPAGAVVARAAGGADRAALVALLDGLTDGARADDASACPGGTSAR
ncbi:thioredoxin family protein [Cellulomonas oligotrophica]|uniref:Thiol-disulfide isomerase/thioredoxin n=1 Tax=Cellulomonas oligotrophica TaxID=931536 RepID=A0A7Y9FEX1_9CELL|nr:thioredoxin family protein [Cellulomonas oligotrophica]NYD86035.1 thiol-disulfide isomerase/thioredoxin [Cellulomonas oligotrophica]GIG30958.1 hypothetical protein Col01nite_01170 [Cellulomonas oligotrophica]